MYLRGKYGIIVVLLICTFFTGCGGNDKSDSVDITGSNPTMEDREDKPKDKEEAISDAMDVADIVKQRIESLYGIENAEVYINHESVLVALRLKQLIKDVDDNLRQEIEAVVYENYDKAKTIAVSSDEDAYKSVERLVNYFEEKSHTKLFLKDMKEIIDKLFKKDGSTTV